MDPSSQERQSLVEEFAAKGLRLTSQRRALLEVIQSAKEHLDAKSLLRLAKERDSSVNRATVYRTLELLKKLRLVDELDLMHLNGEKHYYEVRSERDHIHLACFRCGKIEEFGSALFERLKQEIGRECGFHINVVRMEVGGSCSDCAKHAD
ncbi:MAG TPA: Fur family transcriptional regulator [Bryobacteraceae bacterium]|jgi:Fur family ferric uptake transcriptional regulator|nr:Fur family transcriptional regulator [Bryobacteraceae bacterium]